MTATSIKVGQVWKSKIDEEKIVILAVSLDEKKIFVCGFEDAIDPELDRKYLVENYEMDIETYSIL